MSAPAGVPTADNYRNGRYAVITNLPGHHLPAPFGMAMAQARLLS